MKWIVKILMKMPADKLADLSIKLFEEISKRTDNTIDDEAVEIIKAIRDAGFSA